MALDGSLEYKITGDAVEFYFSIKNEGRHRVDLEFQSGKIADVAIYQHDVEVWRWSDERMFTHAIETKSLEPGQTIETTFTWDDPAAGEYEVVATLEGSREVSAQTRVDL